MGRVNQALVKENGRLKSQFKTQEDDREFLIRQLVAVKKDNSRLRQETESQTEKIEKLEQELEALQVERKQQLMSKSKSLSMGLNGNKSSLPAAGRITSIVGNASLANSASASSFSAVTEHKYKEIIRRLKKLLETERKNLKQVRSQFASELEDRTQLEVFLRQCVQDVKHDIAKERQVLANAMPSGLSSSQSMRSSTPDGQEGFGGLEVDRFSADDRGKVLELPLSKERVVSLLYKKTFSKNQNKNNSTDLLHGSSSLQELPPATEEE